MEYVARAYDERKCVQLASFRITHVHTHTWHTTAAAAVTHTNAPTKKKSNEFTVRREYIAHRCLKTKTLSLDIYSQSHQLNLWIRLNPLSFSSRKHTIIIERSQHKTE